MCGIVGIKYKNKKAVYNDCNILPEMISRIIHRGPDAQDYWYDKNGRGCLGFARLSIIDLSSRAMQPMWNADNTIAITFNGEFYAFQKERQKLQKRGIKFRSNGDAEVVLYMYQEYGLEKTLFLLRGMYAFAIWDKRYNDKIILVRDRMGQKPLYYQVSQEGLIWASELKALKAHPVFNNVIDDSFVPLFMMFAHIPPPYTPYKDTYKIPPASYAVYEDGNLDIRSYWSLDYRNKFKPDSLKELQDQFKAILDDAVSIRLQSDVPIGLFLSGGVDSTCIAQEVKKQKSNIKAFVAGFKGSVCDETENAEFVADKLGIDLVKTDINQTTLTDIDKLISHLDEPFSDIATLPLMKISKAAKPHFTVVLTGDGGDEQQGGYINYELPEMFSSLLPFNLRYLIYRVIFNKFVNNKIKYGMRKRLVPEMKVINSLEVFHVTDFELKRYKDTALEYILSLDARHRKKTDNLFDYFLSYQHEYMTNCFSAKTDIATMYHSLEARSPLMDHKLFEFTSGLKKEYFYENFKGKQLLKNVLKENFSNQFLNSKKRGFSVPLMDWADSRFKFLKEIKNNIKSDHFNYKMAWSSYVLDSYLKVNRI
ncbi:MAG: asparagine synthase (glutamine-hydrolyzing) [bacterium]|nr:asparagine synthase (glutamine-hydrolyzing) [bacterium]